MNLPKLLATTPEAEARAPRASGLDPGRTAAPRSGRGLVGLLRAARERDPAARSMFEVLLCYPGVHALMGHRLAHWLWQHRLWLPGRLVAHGVRFLTGIEIHPGARIGPGCFIDHGLGVVIGETVEIGADVTLYHGVTLGGASLAPGKRHPTLQDRVVVGAGAKVLGPITVGHDSRIGANAVVVKTVPSHAVVVGVPGEVIRRREPRSEAGPLDLDDGRVPHVLGQALAALTVRLADVEARLDPTSQKHRGPQPSDGVWDGLDFSI